MFSDLIKNVMTKNTAPADQPTATESTTPERIKALVEMKSSLPFKLHADVDTFILDGTSVADAKVKLFDAATTVHAAPVEPAAVEPAPIATTKTPLPAATELGQDHVKAHMTATGCTLEEAIMACATKLSQK